MSNFTDFISSGGGAVLETIILTTSQTWTPPLNGTGLIHVIGAGASGTGNSSDMDNGGAGAYCRKAVTFSTGTNWTIVVGAGGRPSRNSGHAGGGSSTANDGSSNIIAGGSTNDFGGNGSGGDVNYSGGRGSGNQNHSSGGGAVGVFANGPTSFPLAGGQSTDANGGMDSFVPLGLGQLIGGKGGSAGESGGFLSGGGSMSTTGNICAIGGAGGIGAGGGAGYNNTISSLRCGGAGGDGIVIVQYLTVS